MVIFLHVSISSFPGDVSHVVARRKCQSGGKTIPSTLGVSSFFPCHELKVGRLATKQGQPSGWVVTNMWLMDVNGRWDMGLTFFSFTSEI